MLSGKARIAGILGWPVSHSRSPRLHGYWLAHYGIDGTYVPFAVRPENLEAVLLALPKLGIAGCNVTIPHKEAVCRLVDSVDQAARRIGAVNTIVVREDGRLHGSNTDGFGFLASLQDVASEWQASSAPAVVLGAGGAARAIVTALLDAGVPALRIANRTRARAERLLADLADRRLGVVDWSGRADCIADAGLLVNTTSLGMEGQPPLELSLERLPTTAVVYDVVYTPLETPLLAAARAAGNQAVDGLGMLLHQARPGFEAWFDIAAEVTPELRAHVLSDITG